MSRKSGVILCSMSPEAMRVFGDVCERIGGIDDACGGGARGESYDPYKLNDLFAAHRTIMGGDPGAGALRSGDSRILRGAQVVHVPPPGRSVAALMDDLMSWLPEAEDHPLIASCIFGYQMLYVHPFEDGNGRLARLWQALLLEKWRPCIGAVDLEAAVDAHKGAYLESLSISDRQRDAGPFALFMLHAVARALGEAESRIPRGRRHAREFGPASARLPESVERLLEAFRGETLTGAALMKNLGMSHRGTFRKNYLDPALEMGLTEMTQPDSPRSPTQRYRLTRDGRRAMEEREEP